MTKCVLVVEDEVLVAMDIKASLEKAGYSVASVLDGESAIEYVGSTSPDVILMDIGLAGELNGIDAAKEIWKTCDMPVVFISGDKNFSFDMLNTHNKVACVYKPYASSDIISAVSFVLKDIETFV